MKKNTLNKISNIENIKVQISLMVIYIAFECIYHLMFSYAYAINESAVLFFLALSFISFVFASFLVILRRKRMFKYFDYPLLFLKNTFSFYYLHTIITAPPSSVPPVYTPVSALFSDLMWYYIRYVNYITTVILLFRVVLWIKNNKNENTSTV